MRIQFYRKSFLVLAILSLVFLISLFFPLPQKDFEKTSVSSLQVVDRHGIVLREFLNDQEGHGVWISLDEISPAAQSATVALEDRRFYYHPGIDPIAIARAIVQDLRAWSARAGGSTITQQVIRNVYHHPRTIFYKAVEAWYALRLERVMSKREILEQYLNRAPYGNQLFGIESAARHYLGKPARDCTLAEAAFLAALPNAPSNLNPYRNLPGVRVRQNVVLKRMLMQAEITPNDEQRAFKQPLQLVSPESNFRAPHFVEMVREKIGSIPSATRISATLDYELQKRIQELVDGHLKILSKKQITNASVVVIENSTGAVRALVGSADYFDGVHSGQVNGATSLRQPGSAVKPFTYSLALESGATPADILPDIPSQIPDEYGDYTPENYDRRYHGPVRMRTALACSYNIPAVQTVRSLGIDALLGRLQAAGISSLTQPASYYGLGLTLGNGDLTLLELTNAYAVFARKGVWKPVRFIEYMKQGDSPPLSNPFLDHRSRRVIDPCTAFLITDILRDPVARRPAFGHAFHFPFQCAVKTGTTKDYRDNWTLGYTTDYTVGVWAGNFDGTPMRGVSGVTGAGQIFADVMMTLHRQSRPRDFGVPDGLVSVVICPRSGKLPDEFCGKTIREWFVKGNEPHARCDVHQCFRFERPDGSLVQRIYEVYKPEYREWAESNHIAVPPSDATRIYPRRSESTSKKQDNRFAILSPNAGDLFKIDPVLRREYQAVKVLGFVPNTHSEVILRVDENEIKPFAQNGTWWELRRGVHRLRLEAVSGGQRVVSRSVAITVE